MEEYVVYEREFESDRELARIVGAQIRGIEGEKVRRMLIEGGWPEKKPTEVLKGSYIWAVLLPVNSTSRTV